MLRDGVKIITEPMSKLSHDDIVKAMVGRPIERFTHEIQNGEDIEFEVKAGQREIVPRLSVKNLSSPGKFEDISFEVNPGEIVGMGGLLGAGRSEVARAIFGIDSYASGTVAVNGVPQRIRNPREAFRAGIVMVPEERKSQGLVLGMTIEENFTLAQPEVISKAGWLRKSRSAQLARELVNAKSQIYRIRDHRWRRRH